MIKLNKALLSIIISAFAVQTTQPIDLGWLTNSSIYKQGTELCSRLSQTDTYKQCAPYGSWLLEKAKEHKTTVAACLVGLFIAKKCYGMYRSYIWKNAVNSEVKGKLKFDATRQDFSTIMSFIQHSDVNIDIQGNEGGITPLFLAVIQEDWRGVKQLIENYKANPDIQTKGGDTPHKAAQRVQNIEAKARIIDIFNGNTEQYEELQRNRTDFERELTRIYDLKVICDDEWATIKELIQERKVEVDHCIKYLKMDLSALYLAIDNENLEMVKLLIEHKTNVHNFPWLDFPVPIIFAAKKQNRDIFKALVAAGASQNTLEFGQHCRYATDILKGKQRSSDGNFEEEEVPITNI